MSTTYSYPVIPSKLNIHDQDLKNNREKWAPVLDRFETALQDVSNEGTAASLARHQSRGQLLLLKVNRMLEIAFENDLPLISLVQSAGVFLPQQFRVFHKGGQLFRDLAVRSLHGMPSCAVVFGSSTAGGAYHPALSDYTIFVAKQAQTFLAGPPLVKMATGEVIGAEELGGAEIHATRTGLADQIASDESRLSLPESTLPAPPRYPIEDLLSLVNPDIRKAFDMEEVVLRLVDDSRLSIFKPKYGPNMLTAWAHIMGFPVGIVANQISVINPNEAAKAAQFIRLCNQE
ncbi:hypothetical protein G7Z17_g7057 [Cylindrodendrum hubeiense]|uniref:CoA carboxyltransferase C-terminal domain-containing protein n=1 Tax=Cylindrodendrum hubeiense TaxID=595255 RepID=A0A9P5H920_9HYPO|nr:hypothetical protein G7Z17_g7057 [Cylindrodendrum hubeiense]